MSKNKFMRLGNVENKKKKNKEKIGMIELKIIKQIT